MKSGLVASVTWSTLKPRRLISQVTDVGGVDKTLHVAEVEVNKHRWHKFMHPVLGSLDLQFGTRDFVEGSLSAIVCFLG